MEGGDFDHTPAPSGRPSLSLLRSDEDGGSAPSISSATRTAGVRHNLLKTSASGPTIVDRDIPVPPVLNQSPATSDAVPVVQMPTVELENKMHAPPRHSSAFSVASCPVMGYERITMSPVTPLSDRAVLGKSPAHQEGLPFRSHHPSHAKSADFDDNGYSTTGSRSAPSTPRARLRNSDNSTKVGEVWEQDAASSDDYRSVDVRVAVPDHYGHSHVSKIRPALQHHPTHRPVIFESHELDIRGSHNKVGPFDPALECLTDSEHAEQKFVSESSTAVSMSDMRSDRRRDSRTRSSHANSEALGSSVGHVCHGHISKVQAAVHCLDVGLFSEEDFSLATDSFTPGHSLEFSVSKVRPYKPSPDHTNKVAQRKAYGSKVKPMVKSNSNSSGHRSRRGSPESIETPSPVRHDAMQFPVAKVKPCVDDSFNAIGPHEGYHHLPKAQGFTDWQPLSALPSQGTLDQCRRCQTTTRFEAHNSDETSKGLNARLANEQTNLSEQPPGKHSISRCEEYPTYAGSEPHTIDMCQHLPPCSGQTQLGPDEVQSQDTTPRPYQTSIEGNQAAGRIPSPDDTSSESSSNIPIQSGGFEVAKVYGVPPFGQGMEPPTRFRNSQSPGPTQNFIHAPIPISKVRPSFQDHSFHEHEGHTAVSKAKAANNGSLSASFQSDRFFDVECDSSQHGGNVQRKRASNGSSGRSQSLGSILDYKRTAQWLRDVLKHPESYTTRFTERPGKSKDAKQASPDERRQSESVLSSVLPTRCRISTRSAKSDSKFDGYGFKRAVSDLERLLNEALAIASQVVDQPEIPPRQRYKQPSISLHSHCHSLTSGNDEYRGSRVNLTSPSAHGSADNVEEIELDEVASPKRPAYRHAAPYSGLPRRPRLNEIIQGYSGTGDEMNMGGFVDKPDERKPTPQTVSKVSFEIPRRRSSRSMARYGVTTTESGKDRADATIKGTQRQVQHDDVPRYTKEIVLQLSPEHEIRHDHGGTARPKGAAGLHGTHGARRNQGTSEEELPDRDLAGRPMHTEHGISLRRRSHVSLRGASGFSLAKSRKRQPTARD
ncbi:hypothetical protein TOPH_03631 [Tolypocladium ophioglossoides CBS 100239]|uniref:Uncharacterized protein n=1 Tax=Tolypocladium ophioglossoides (strain CBS 100239) TaxID=1163406 RepID=A0A0L0NCQ3_TOLOC|nr:hypothetical protein TOPH_03631 [Tolypocladium ophioglossoides CBS 100239]